MKTYNLVWIVNSEIRETIVRGSCALCQWKKNQVKSNYTSGLLQIRSDESIEYNLNSRNHDNDESNNIHNSRSYWNSLGNALLH